MTEDEIIMQPEIDSSSKNEDHAICEEDQNFAQETVSDADASGETADEVENEHNELDALKNELEILRKELEERKRELERVNREISDFSELFPDVSVTALPDSVWETVKSGVPLAAAYSLYKRKTELRLEKAAQTNQKNCSMSTGAIGRDTNDNFYTPSEVKAMSRSEIRKNYQKIIESMKKWN